MCYKDSIISPSYLNLLEKTNYKKNKQETVNKLKTACKKRAKTK